MEDDRVGLKWRSLIELIPIRIELVGDYGSWDFLPLTLGRL